MARIDTTNDQLVGVQSGKIVIMLPRRVMTPPEALRHAAWLVCLASGQMNMTEEGTVNNFLEIWKAVSET